MVVVVGGGGSCGAFRVMNYVSHRYVPATSSLTSFISKLMTPRRTPLHVIVMMLSGVSSLNTEIVRANRNVTIK